MALTDEAIGTDQTTPTSEGSGSDGIAIIPEPSDVDASGSRPGDASAVTPPTGMRVRKRNGELEPVSSRGSRSITDSWAFRLGRRRRS